MNNQEKKFYITTPIYYVTAKPHLGSLYSTLIADALARWNKLLGKKVFFLTGTDEHGQKIAQAAEKAGMAPKAFVDSFVPAYQDAWKQYEIEYSKFIRTTDPEHILAVQKWLEQLQTKGDIYKSVYTGWYCTSDETFVTESADAKVMAGQESSTNNLNAGPVCPSCGRPTQYLSEETYFFKLSAYQEKLLLFYQQNPDFIQPRERFAEVLNFVQAGLKDLSISRTTVSWGIPFPNDSKHVAYVWADALANYITAVGFNTPGSEKEFKFWWPADMQVLGKDIVRFHAVFWPAFLMASDLPMPKRLIVHGWIKMNQQKMSKSFGNVVDPIELGKKYGVEPVRYYLLRQLAITHDSEFDIADLEQRVSSDLANDLGNLLNRLVMLAEKYDAMILEASGPWSGPAVDLRDAGLTMIAQVKEYMNDALIHMALASVWTYINKVNAYFHAQEPWKVAKSNPIAFKEILTATAHALQLVGIVLWPIMPSKMEQLLSSLGVKLDVAHDLEKVELAPWKQKFVLMKIPVLFERPLDKESEKIMKQVQKEATLGHAEALAKAETTPLITIDDFLKVELCIGMIEHAEFVEKSDKLLKLQVDFGPKGKRQIFSGIRKHYAPEELIGKQGTFVFNLQPRKMMGSESHGMMLFAEDATGKLQIVAPRELVPNGTQLR